MGPDMLGTDVLTAGADWLTDVFCFWYDGTIVPGPANKVLLLMDTRYSEIGRMAGSTRSEWS